jgi:hypothetical protein
MRRSSIAVVAALAFTTHAAAAQSVAPPTLGSQHPVGFASKIIHIPSDAASSVLSSSCSPRSVASQSALRPKDAKSHTLIAVPLGWGNVSSETTQYQSSEVCAQQRH